MHECKITADDTALITVYEKATADDGTDFVDGLIQEIDIESGELLFEWRASEHVDSSTGYMSESQGGELADGYLDYFHVNSVDKGSDGNYLVSVRHTHQILCLDGFSGDTIWALGGTSQDFEDLSEGAATSFMWQHDARWVSEKEGIISVFHNGRARKHHDRSYSQGLLIQLDLQAWTVTLLQDFNTLERISSASQGNVQTIDGDDGERHYFIGWGSSAAFSEHSESGELLYEAHYGAATLYWFERVKSYRTLKAPHWRALPHWDPSARLMGNRIYVSWNGATVVSQWALEGHRSNSESGEDMDPDEDWDIISGIEKRSDFECALELPKGDAYASYQVVALDQHGNSLRRSNVIAAKSRPGRALGIIVVVLVGASIVAIVAAASYVVRRRKEHRTGCWPGAQKYEIV